MKIWNHNDYSGVLGVFNCQGAGWCTVGKKNLIHDEQPGTVTGIIRSRDVCCSPKIAGDGWNGNAIIFSHLGGKALLNLIYKVLLLISSRCRTKLSLIQSVVGKNPTVLHSVGNVCRPYICGIMNGCPLDLADEESCNPVHVDC